MELTLHVTRCDTCKRLFRDGDPIYTIDFTVQNRACCKECYSQLFDPVYIFHRGCGVRILNEGLLKHLTAGNYALELIGDVVTIRYAGSYPVFGGGTYLECFSEQKILLLSEEQRSDWIEIEERFEENKLFALFKGFQQIIVDKDWHIYGFSNSSDLISGIIPPEEQEEKKFRCVPLKELEVHYDLSLYAQQVRQALRRVTPKEMLAFCEESVQGQGLELRKAVYLIWQYLQCVRKGKPFQAYNWFLTAPSGCGKTEFYRTLRRFFKEKGIPIPVVQIDLSRITEEGFKGLDPSNIVDMIKNDNSDSTGYAICFLDEADKKIMPNFDSHGNNVNSNMQSALLTLVEGSASEMDKDGVSKNFDTGKTMFIFMGAFQDLRNERQKEAKRVNALGFSSVKTEDADIESSLYQPITMEDIIKFGMQEELAGRIQQIVNFKRLSDEAMLELILKKTQKISEEMGISIYLSEIARTELLSIAFGNLGLRQPLNKIRELTLNTISASFFEGELDTKKHCLVIHGLDEAAIVSVREAAPSHSRAARTYSF